jgi:hypothetical protein
MGNTALGGKRRLASQVLLEPGGLFSPACAGTQGQPKTFSWFALKTLHFCLNLGSEQVCFNRIRKEQITEKQTSISLWLRLNLDCGCP